MDRFTDQTNPQERSRGVDVIERIIIMLEWLEVTVGFLEQQANEHLKSTRLDCAKEA